ncbi:uncharacterized protein Z519_01718 [Cladophialophora bantiana CBS 173.52]|uniref:GPN-loop GTPase 2 n=1 Tax=Cladophialophora bantiana (strain ATCC 10958 / CBS 173.52 / CDC B-1940 / NIH 8579) TaxID=1442370 RepID=A0A0D2IMX6_CLAB1|nr:uncharacterized protein Z519_01718 [Cladophialophora bantiana CBS 173.52]KIW98134.1 hypothetical protein Z519_01718 [Cladophialophora bantiana CBS 173.52]
MPFAQLVIGPPGAGKSTYCNGMQQFMGAIGRKCSVVNLDPANDPVPSSSYASYEPALDIRDLISLDTIMRDEEIGLGPNGGVLYALEELEENFDGWFEEGLKRLGDDYILFDCPGQVELFTHHGSLRRIFGRLEKIGYRLVVVNLIDSYALTLPSLYISTLLLSLRSMLQLDFTHINVLTKIDNLSKYPPLPFNLDFYTEVQDLSYLLPYLEEESPMFKHGGKFQALNEAIVQLVEEYGLVGFETLAVEDKKSMMSLLHTIDRAGGYAFGGAEGANDSVWQVAVREGLGKMDVRDVQERWIDRREEYDELERKEWEEEQKRREVEWVKSGEGMMRMNEDGDEDMSLPPMKDGGVKVMRSGNKHS